MGRTKEEYEMRCALCGVKDTVPFPPKDDTLCRKCHKNARKHIPRKRHGTRVSFPITCNVCGKYEVLNYRPKVPLTQVKCTECMASLISPKSQWATIEQEKVQQAERERLRLLREHEEREEEEDEIVDGSKNALSGAQSLGKHVYIRPKTNASDQEDQHEDEES